MCCHVYLFSLPNRKSHCVQVRQLRTRRVLCKRHSEKENSPVWDVSRLGLSVKDPGLEVFCSQDLEVLQPGEVD